MKKQLLYSLISLLVISGCKNIISSTSKESSKLSSNIISSSVISNESSFSSVISSSVISSESSSSSVISSSSEYIMPTTEEEMFLEVKKALDFRRTYEGDITIEVNNLYSSYSKNQNEESSYTQNAYETYSISNDGRRYSMNAFEQSDSTSSIKQVRKEKEYIENNERLLIEYSLYEENGELQHEFTDLYRLLDGSISTDVDLNEEYQFEILASSLDELKDSYEFVSKKIRDSYYEEIVTTSNITIEAKENNTIVLTKELILDSSYTDEKSINTFIIIEGKLKSACSIFENINYLNDEDPTETISYNKTYEVNYDYKFNDELFNSLEVSEDAVAMDLFKVDTKDFIIDFGEFEIEKDFDEDFYESEATYYDVYLDMYQDMLDDYEGLDIDETFYYDEEKTKPIDFNKITKEEILGLERIYANAELKDGYALLYTDMEIKKDFSDLFKIAINNLNNVELPSSDHVYIFNLIETNKIVLGDYIYYTEFYLDDKLVSDEDTLVLENQKSYKVFYYDEYNDDNMGLNIFGLIY